MHLEILKKDQLINSLNERDCVVEVYFTEILKKIKINYKDSLTKYQSDKYV